MTGRSPSSYRLSEIVRRFGGELVGGIDAEVTRVATLENAGPDSITFLANSRYEKLLKTTRAGAVIVGPAQRSSVHVNLIVCDNPYVYFARVSALFAPTRHLVPGTHPTAVVDVSADVGSGSEIGALAVIGANARIGRDVLIGAGCIIGDHVDLGDGTRLHPNVVIYDGCRIGRRALLHSGAVIGADGFGIASDGERWVKVPQVGRVLIGDDVEIGANTTIDRGAIDDTVIEDGVKLDNQIQVGHNVRIGAHTAIAACVGIAGSSRIGRHCRIGGASGIAGHLTIADNVEVSAHTLITKSIGESGAYTGAYPFESNRDWRRNAAQLRHLRELADRVRALEAALGLKGEE